MVVSSFDQFLRQLPDPDTEYRPVAFWFLNHWLERDELIRQIREMARKGMGGIMCHARDGLRSGYLDAEWEEHLRTIVDEAKQHGLQVWLYDENHYPSGPAGGKLNLSYPDRTMKTLIVVWEDTFEPRSRVLVDLSGQLPDEWLAVAASLDGASVVDLSPCMKQEALEWTVPSDGGRVVVMVLGVVGWQSRPFEHFRHFPDYLDPDVTDDFIRLTHEWYYDRFGDDFGTTIRGIFTDNSCGNFGHIRRALPWGRGLAERFRKATGESIIDHLPGLFYRNVPGALRSRLMYWRFFGNAYMESFLGRITAYCDSKGLLSTGHLCLEDGMGEHVRQIGDYFEVMRNFSLTAVDQLGPGNEGDGPIDSCGENLLACIKNTHSAALYSGSPRVMCESFGLAGRPWKLDIGEVRRISGWLAATGVDLFLPHGLFYSIAGSRKWECTPDHLHNPMWECYKEWTDWISRLCLASAGGSTCAEVAVLYPGNSLRAAVELGDSWAKVELGDNWAKSDLGPEEFKIRRAFFFALETLHKEQVDFQVIDEECLCRAGARSGVLEVPCPGREPAAFRVMVLPHVTVIDGRTNYLLQRFAESGGTVIMLGAAPQYILENDTLLEPAENSGWRADVIDTDSDRSDRVFIGCVLAAAKRRMALERQDNLVSRSWKNYGLNFHFVFNYSATQTTETRVDVDDADPLSRVDLYTGAVEPWNKGTARLGPAEALLLVSGLPCVAETPRTAEEGGSDIIPCGGLWAAQPDRDNILPLREWKTSVEGDVQRHSFHFESGIEAEARLLMDLEKSVPELHSGTYGPRLICKLNGKDVGPFVPGTYLDRNIYEVPVTIAAGINQLEVQLTGYITSWEYRLWPPMVIGSFGIDDFHSLAAPVQVLEEGDWGRQGFPFYSGKITYTRQLEIPPASSVVLCLGDVANACHLDIDGTRAGCLSASPWRFDLSQHSGKTVLVAVTVINTPNNLFSASPMPSGLIGPVHLEIKQ